MTALSLGWQRTSLHGIHVRGNTMYVETTYASREGQRVVIFKEVRDGKPYPDHGMTMKQWAEIPPRPVRLDQLITTKRELGLDRLLAEDSTFYGDLFPHVVQWDGKLYLEDGVHRALRAALQQRTTIHARVLVI